MSVSSVPPDITVTPAIKVTFAQSLLSSASKKTRDTRKKVRTAVETFVTIEASEIRKLGGNQAVITDSFHSSRSEQKKHATTDFLDPSDAKVGVAHVFENASGDIFPYPANNATTRSSTTLALTELQPSQEPAAIPNTGTPVTLSAESAVIESCHPPATSCFCSYHHHCHYRS
ncbi:hypothetical protein FRB95_007818 [Tulasnella sp. JGI-2019a]|nr:hypothetical protein FRB95_007818 [Tulasnella sp. JGI-2019a]